jgi:PAS domain S-box-containing protein
MELFLKRIFVIWFSLMMFLPVTAKKPTAVTLQLKWKHQFQFAGYYAAVEKGFYKDAGIQVSLLEAVEGQNPSEAVIDGRAEFGVSTSDILIMRSHGNKVVVLANIFQHSPQILLASKKSGIQHVHDLIGKTIAMEPNAADIIAFLNDEGIVTGKYIVDQHVFNADKLINGKIDVISAYSTDEPFVLQEANFEYTIISPSMGGIDFYGDGLFTTEALIKKDPLLVENFRAASLKGWKYAMENPEEIIELIYQKYSQRHSLEHLRFEANQMKNLIMPDVVEIGYSNHGRWESIGNTYKKLKMVDASFTIDGLFYADYQKPQNEILWRLIAGFLLILLVVASVTYFFYNVSKKLRNEIKNRLEIEKKLVESEEQYRSLVENSPDAIIIYKDEIIVFANKECLRLMRAVSMDELTGKPVLQFVHPDYQSLVIERMKNAASLGRTLPTIEEKLIRTDGSEVLVEVKAIPIQLLNRPAVQLIIQDLTGRKLSETALQESEEKFREMADLLPQIVFESDMQGKLTYVNKQAFKILGFPEDYDTGSLNTINLYIPEDRPRAVENIKRRMMGNRDDSNEYTMIRFDESLINVLVYSNPIYKESQLVGLRGIIVDITDRKLANIQIKQKNDELEKLNATKDKFFSIIAHDLKSPFNSILGFSEILAKQVHNNEYDGIKKYADIILNSSQRAIDLLMNLMEWSRSQTGRMDFTPENFEMVSLINETAMLFDEIARQKSIILIRDLPAKAPVLGDKAMLSTVLRNLISNAIKFTMSGGKITISAQEKPGELIVSVRDSGVGIPENIIEILFQLSENFSTPGTNNEKGTGLGLILCKEFIEKHGGKIWGESELRKGSTFSFSLPVKENNMKN